MRPNRRIPCEAHSHESTRRHAIRFPLLAVLVIIAFSALPTGATVAAASTIEGLLVEPPVGDFGEVPLGTCFPITQEGCTFITFTLTNVGSSPIPFQQYGVGAPGTFLREEGQTCDFNLSPGESCQIGVGFAPPRLGLSTGALTVLNANLETIADIPLRVIGIPGSACAGAGATIVGTAGPDFITGTRFPDVIVGLGGDDKIKGLEGNDKICGNGGTDVLWAGEGNDAAFGGAGADLVHGGLGHDRPLSGGGGNDAVYGDDGLDRLWGNSGADLLHAGPGDDTLDGGADHDKCNGGLGDRRRLELRGTSLYPVSGTSSTSRPASLPALSADPPDRQRRTATPSANLPAVGRAESGEPFPRPVYPPTARLNACVEHRRIYREGWTRLSSWAFLIRVRNQAEPFS